MNAVKQRDIEAQYNKRTIEELSKNTRCNWSAYFAALGVKDIKDVIVGQPLFMKEMSKMYKSIPMNDWKTYFRWHLIDGASPFLSDEIVLQNLSFSRKF